MKRKPYVRFLSLLFALMLSSLLISSRVHAEHAADPSIHLELSLGLFVQTINLKSR